MFGLKKKKAIKILHQQFGKLNDQEFLADQNWITETQSYIHQFLGPESSEARYINEFRFSDRSTTEEQVKENRRKAKTFVNNCIRRINEYGLYKLLKVRPQIIRGFQKAGKLPLLVLFLLQDLLLENLPQMYKTSI